MGLSNIFLPAVAGGVLGGIGQGASAIAQDRQKQEELAHKTRLEDIAANKGTMTPSDISTLATTAGLKAPVGLSGRIPDAGVTALLGILQKQSDTQRGLEQGRTLADSMTTQYGRVVPKPGDSMPGPIQPTVDDPYARQTIDALRTVGVTDKTAGQAEAVGKAFSDRAEKDRQRNEGLSLLERMGVLPKTQPPADQNGGLPPALATGPTDSPETVTEVGRARDARSRIAPEILRDRAPAGGVNAKPPLPPGTRMATNVPISTVHGDGKVEVRLSEPTDPHDLAAISEYGTTFRNLPEANRQYVRGLLQREKVEVSTVQGAGNVTAKSNAESDLPLYRSGARRPGEHIIDMTKDAEVDYIGERGSNLEKNSKNYKVISADAYKQWVSIKEMEGMFSEFERIAPQLVKQPGLNKLQQLEFWAKNAMGVPGLQTDLDALRGATLRVAKAMQGSAQGLSDADRKTVEGMLPTPTDTAESALRRLQQAYRIMGHMKGALLGTSRATEKVREAVGDTGPAGNWTPK